MLDYKNILATVRGILVDHNTTTASPDLSASLGSYRIDDDSVRIGDPEIQAIEVMKHHSVFVRISDKDEEWAGIGRTGLSGVPVHGLVRFQVVGFFRKDGAVSPHSDMLNGAFNLARNIEGVFREKYTLSGTALWCHPVSTDFYGPFDVSGSWIKTVLIKVEAKYQFK